MMDASRLIFACDVRSTSPTYRLILLVSELGFVGDQSEPRCAAKRLYAIAHVQLIIDIC
jgi:hypothetical protein